MPGVAEGAYPGDPTAVIRLAYAHRRNNPPMWRTNDPTADIVAFPPPFSFLWEGQLTATCNTPTFGIAGQSTTVTFEAPLQGIYTISLGRGSVLLLRCCRHVHCASAAGWPV